MVCWPTRYEGKYAKGGCCEAWAFSLERRQVLGEYMFRYRSLASFSLLSLLLLRFSLADLSLMSSLMALDRSITLERLLDLDEV